MKLFNKSMFRFDVFVENINTGMTDRYTVMATDVKQAKKEIKRRRERLNMMIWRHLLPFNKTKKREVKQNG